MRLFLQIVLVVLIAGIIAMFTKPADEECHAKASAEVKKFLKGQVQTDIALVNRMIEKMTKENVWIEDKVFYKEIKFTFKGATKTVGYGYFGYININGL